MFTFYKNRKRLVKISTTLIVKVVYITMYLSEHLEIYCGKAIHLLNDYKGRGN